MLKLKPMKIGYLGPQGSYTHISALKVFPGNNGNEHEAYKTITDAIEALANGKIDQAILPIENSIAGGVAETLDSLLEAEGIYINHEFILPIHHCLLGKDENISLAKISQIHAHPMSFGQCRKFLRSSCPDADLEVSSSNSAAASYIAGEQTDSSNASIGPELSAEIYNLKVLAKNINDEDSNETRFWVLSKKPSPSTGKDKTTIVFRVHNEPGSLVKILKYFAEAGIDLSRIESRPSKKILGEYCFCLDFNVHKEDDRFVEVMNKVKMYFSFYKWLGSYNLI